MREKQLIHKTRILSPGLGLTEMLVVVFIFTFLIAAVFSVLASSDRAWRIGQNKLIQQQEARKIMSQMIRLLRQSSPEWTDGVGNPYPTSISEGNSKIEFFIPAFTSDGQITAFRSVIFKPNPEDSRQLLKKEGTANPVLVGQEIVGVSFGGGCAGCTAFNCSTVADDCPQVRLGIMTQRGDEAVYVLNSQVTLRNSGGIIPDGVTVEEPEEGEF